MHDRPYNLKDRTLEFSKSVLEFSSRLPLTVITKPLINQLVRSATSIGANFFEADEASSRKDFVNKCTIAKKEAKETRYWLELLAHTSPDRRAHIELLAQEAKEINLILNAMIKNTQPNQ